MGELLAKGAIQKTNLPMYLGTWTTEHWRCARTLFHRSELGPYHISRTEVDTLIVGRASILLRKSLKKLQLML
jgi:hypothetical protein